MLTEQILQNKAKYFALKYWNLDFNLPVKINSRLSILSGSYKYRVIDGEHIPRRIEISKKLLENYKEETIYSTLKHELCHWALAVTNQPFVDGHPIFEKELKRIKAHSTNTLELAGNLHKGTCGRCDKLVVEGPTRKSINKFLQPKNRYVSKCCGEIIVYGGTIYREDTNTFVACHPSRDFSSIVIKERTGGNTSEKNYNNEKGDGCMTTVVSMKIEELIQPNKRGKVTNAQMIPALVTAIEAGSKEQLDLLKSEYPEVFEASSTKYLNKKHSTAFIKIVNGLPLEEAPASEATPVENSQDEVVNNEDQNPGEEVTSDEDQIENETANKNPEVNSGEQEAV